VAKNKNQNARKGRRAKRAACLLYLLFLFFEPLPSGHSARRNKNQNKGQRQKKILFFQLILPLAFCNPPVPGLQKARGLSSKNLQEPCL